MTALTRLTRTEFTLLRRDTAAMILPFAIPLGLLVGFGSAPDIRAPNPEFGGLSAFDVTIVPIALLVVVALLALSVFPVTLASYRERGVLRRLATTPIHPSAVLAAQLVVHLLLLAASLAVALTVASVAFDLTLPRRLGVSFGALALTAAALYTVGLAVAAVAPKATTATAIGMGLYFPQLLFGGLMVPAELLPDIMARIGEFTPVGAGMHAIQASWVGEPLEPLHLAVLGVTIVLAGTVAARRFRWD